KNFLNFRYHFNYYCNSIYLRKNFNGGKNPGKNNRLSCVLASKHLGKSQFDRTVINIYRYVYGNNSSHYVTGTNTLARCDGIRSTSGTFRDYYDFSSWSWFPDASGRG